MGNATAIFKSFFPSHTKKDTIQKLENQKNATLCQELLNKTSRTFALNLPLLKGDTYWSVLIAYLLCRILDTIEDAENLSIENKKKLIQRYIFLIKNNNHAQTNKWVQDFTHLNPKGRENDLFLNTQIQAVLDVFFQLPKFHQQHTITLVETMSYGMLHFLEKNTDENSYTIKNSTELEQYCYYVAGTVGEFLTQCFQHNHSFHDYKGITSEAVSFGYTLQLTNIIKDFKQDKDIRNACYIPQDLIKKHHTPEQAILKGLLPLASKQCFKSFSYIKKFKQPHVRNRLFCLWPLWLAIKTLKKSQKNITNKNNQNYHVIKITKIELYWTLLSVTLLSFFPRLLEKNFKKNMAYIQNI